jgi:two-component system, NtrC family, sensor kinase
MHREEAAAPVETQLTALFDLGQRLILLRDPQEIAEAVLDIAVRVLDFHDSDFLLIDEGRQELYLAARRGQIRAPTNLRLPLEGGRGVTVAAARSGRPVYVPDVSQDLRYVYTGFSAASELAVPVQVEGRVLGVLNVESAQRDAFGDADQDLLTLLANQAALALENARLYEIERRQAEEMRILNELAHRINASLDLQATLDAIVSAAADLIPCALAEVSLWDEQSQRLTLAALRCDAERAFPLGRSFPPGEGYTGWLVRHRRPLLVSDVEAHQEIHPDLLPGELPFRAYAGVPLRAGEALAGTLVLVSERTGAFDAGDLRLLEALAHHSTAAIQNARLYQEANRQNRILSALSAIAEVVNRPGDLDMILSEGLRQVLAVTCLDMGAIALADSSSGRLALQCQEGMPTRLEAWLRGKLGQKSLEGWPQGEGFQIEEIPPDGPGVPPPIREAGIRQIAEVPLFAEGALVGVLSITTREPRPFTSEERALLQSIGHQLGTALANARLRQELLMAERLAAVGRVAASVAHDLRSPLGGILRSAEFLARPELSPAMRQKLSQAVISLIHRLINTSQQIMDYVHKEKLPLKRSPCSLSTFLDGVLAVLDVDLSDRGVEVVRHYDYQGQVVIDADRMAQVFCSIAANARDAMPQGGMLTVTTRQHGEQVEMQFSDTGPGVPDELRDQIFEPFFTFGKREGAGLGLSIARRIVEEHGGELRVEGNQERGATFVLTLPL